MPDASIYPIILITNDGRLFAVRPYAASDHASRGIAVRRSGGGFVARAGAREQLVRVAAARIVANVAGLDNQPSHDQSAALLCS